MKQLKYCMLLLCLNLSAPSWAAQDSIPASLHQQFSEIRALLSAGKATQAQRQLTQLNPPKSPYALALYLQLQGYAQLQLQQYAKAQRSLDKALQQAKLPKSLRADLYELLLQALLQQQKFSQAAKLIPNWQTTQALNAAQLQLAAYIFSQNQQWQQAKTHWQQAIKASKNAPLDWQQQLLNACLQTQDQAAAIAPLKALLAAEPQQKNWWLYLAQAYWQTEQTDEAISSLELADKQGLLQAPTELQRLAHWYIKAGTPQRAAQFLQQALTQNRLTTNADNLYLLLHAYWQAQNFAGLIAAAERWPNEEIKIKNLYLQALLQTQQTDKACAFIAQQNPLPGDWRALQQSCESSVD